MNAEVKSSTTTEAEPTSAFTPVPLWLVSATLMLLCGSAVMFDRSSGWFEAQVHQPYTSVADIGLWQPLKSEGPDLVRGKYLFELNCSACHGNDGLGKPGQFPPLAGSEWVTAEGANRIIRIPLLGLSGPITIKGQPWSASMPSVATLSDKQISDILSYVRNSWGNKAPMVTADEVKAVRAEIGNRTQATSADELSKLPEKK